MAHIDELVTGARGPQGNLSKCSIDPARAFQVLADVAPAGIWQTDPAGEATFVNETFLQLAGLKKGEWEGPDWVKAVHPEDLERVFGAWMQAVENRTNFRAIWRWLHADGSVVWVETIGAPDVDEQGDVCGFVGINVDITQTKQIEAELRAARQKAEDATRAKSAFLANMSHEIRTPMNGVLGFTDLMLAGDLSHTQRGYAQLIADSGQAMMQLLNDILDMAKIEAGQMDMHYSRIELAHKLKTCLRLVEAVAHKKGLRLVLDIAPDLPTTITTDPLRLRQVIFNLLGNAAKFTEYGSISLTAKLADDGNGVIVAVTDTGSGIPEEKHDAIFHQFMQSDITIARKYGGSGLGLAITGQLVTMLGGTISLDSEVGRGSTFSVHLPLVPDQATSSGAHQVVPRLEAAGDPAQPSSSLARILVVEDHDINQLLIMTMLEELELEADLAENGQEALDKISAAGDAGCSYALVLMDIQMPVLDGMQTARRIRHSGIEEEELPIVALTANCYAEDIAACLQAGMQGHLAKPVKVSALSKTIARHMPPHALPMKPEPSKTDPRR